MTRAQDLRSVPAAGPALLVLAAGLLGSPLGWPQTVAQPVLESGTVEKELRALETAHAAAVESKDVDRILQFYTTDLITVPAGRPILRGREWIRSSVAELLRTHDLRETFTLSDIRTFGDRAAATYQYRQRLTPLAGGKAVVETGKGMCILKRARSGRWQFEWNAYAPDGGPPAASE